MVFLISITVQLKRRNHRYSTYSTYITTKALDVIKIEAFIIEMDIIMLLRSDVDDVCNFRIKIYSYFLKFLESGLNP